MKIYTRTGDKGQTALYGGVRRSKADNRIEAYGSVDELVASLGLLLVWVKELGVDFELQIQALTTIQLNCFVLCAELARLETQPNRKDPVLNPDVITWLEKEIDELERELPKLKRFILQGGSLAGAQAHICRSVCRRAERAVVRLSQEEKVSPCLVQYLNRLSDYLFVLARFLNFRLDIPETIWESR